MNITPENVHVYIFSIIGLLLICFITLFYIKSSLETEIETMKKKMKKMQGVQKILYGQIRNISEKQQQEEQEKLARESQQEAENENEGDERMGIEDVDSYIDPLN
ncbi:MAG: hypothetical protein Terrestrivirus4_11 [Terrestrivirus sp.]|uniref:Uncharacterized protein n=1 Tax=Terrestrivirus sp. TaxID=2487775 RepID=A0A3G4ZQT0_9VIRU|nr:MAG: hypothetical protein Terrestrivirus4_11 [Terrestrivirus sp.]